MIRILNSILNCIALAAGGAAGGVTGQFTFNDFNPNEVAKIIINSLVGLLSVAGIVVGGIFLFLGFMNEDPKEKRNGVIGMLASLIIGGLILTVTNTIIA